MKKFIVYFAVFNLLFWSISQAQEEKVLVVVNSFVYAALEPEILRYVDDISFEYEISLFETSGGSEKDLKDFIKSRTDNLVGCILIGNMPVYWYEIEQDEINFNRRSVFPCDLYFMDLDGSWSDMDHDGFDDTHTGNVSPEIFLARIDASAFSAGDGNEIEILRNFFNRDHNYWTGSYDLRKTGLVYTDLDWKNFGPLNEDMQYLYGINNFQIIKDNRIDSKDYLENRLSNSQYEFIQVAAHSSADGHWFFLKQYMSLEDIWKGSLKALGYNLFACSACDYSTQCLGNAYIFGEREKSLAVIGTTKIGSMLQFYAFYKPLGQNESIGQAYRKWFSWIAPFTSEEIAWHYGMTLLGDPMIRFNSGTPNHGPLIDIGGSEEILWPCNPSGSSAILTDDGLPLDSNLTYNWEQVDGPGTVAFEDAHAVSTTTGFSGPGLYRIKFTASDGQFTSEDSKNIKVSRIKWEGEVGTFAQQNAIVIRDTIAFDLASNELHIISIVNKSNPVIIQSYDFQEVLEHPCINSLDVDSAFAYLALSEKGLRIVDISDLQNPNEVSAFQTHDASERQNAVKVVGNLAYIADNERGLMVLDVHDRTNPVLTGFYPTEGPARALAVQEDFAYIADGSNGLRIIDISDKYNPVECGSFAINCSDDQAGQFIQVTGNYAYILYYDTEKGNCISIIDISNKNDPVEIGRLEDPLMRAFHVEGNYLYFAGHTFWNYDLFGIYDITNKANPGFIESYKMENIYFQDIRNITADGEYVYLLDNLMYNGLNIFRVRLPNTEPLAYAGDNKVICENSILLKGMSFDDKMPSDSVLSFSWEQVSGQTEVEFITPYDRNTQAIFSDSGNYVLRLIVSDGDLTAHDDIRITALNKPPEGNNVELCEGLNVPDLTAYGNSITWYGNTGLTDTLGTGVNFSTGKTLPGSYTYYVTQVISGCESRPDSVKLTILPVPGEPSTEDVTLCATGTIPFLVSRGKSIKWYSDSTLQDLICVGDSLIPTESESGNYTYYVTQTDSGCESTFAESVLTINPLPEISLGNDTIISPDQNLLLSPGAVNCSYLWNDGSKDPDFEFRGNDMDTGLHFISVVVTDSNACSNSDTMSILVLPATGVILTETNPRVQYYPNPTTGHLYIKFQSIRKESILIMFLDQKGSLIKSAAINADNSDNIYSFDLSYLVPGIYYMKIIISGEQFVNKILLE